MTREEAISLARNHAENICMSGSFESIPSYVKLHEQYPVGCDAEIKKATPPFWLINFEFKNQDPSILGPTNIIVIVEEKDKHVFNLAIF